MSEVMTTDHPGWDEFCERLGGPGFCHFRETDTGDTTWNCTDGIARPGATRILTEMEGIDVTASLEWMRENGGGCDCEILFNCDVE